MNDLIQYSFAGLLHNKVIQSLTQLSNFPDYSETEVYNFSKETVESYYSDNKLGNPNVLPFSEYQDQVNTVMTQGEDMSNYFISLQDEGKINREQLNFLLNINSLVVNSDDSNKLCNNLFSLQQEINLSTIPFEEKVLVYGTAVIAYHSSYYWFSAYNNSNDPWYNTVPIEKRLRWWVKALRDLAGFTAGFIVGSLISGGNPAVGIAGGTVTGSGASSSK